jgi:hypothetical protein
MQKLILEVNKMRNMMGLDSIEEFDTSGRTSMSEFMSEETDNVDTLIKMMSKYTPEDYWMISVGYVNNTNIPVTVKPSKELEDLGTSFKDEYIDSLIGSDEWKSGKMKHPHAAKTVKGEKIPSTIYKMKTYTCQWLSKDARNKMKSDRDSKVMSAYTKRGLEPPEIDVDDKRGAGWEDVEGTPFSKHGNTGTQKFVMYRKTNCYKDTASTYFIKINDKIEELGQDKANFYFKMSQTDNSVKMPARMAAIEDEEMRKELFDIENMYEYKNIDLSKIPFLNCTCVVDGKGVRLTYVNKNATPDGLNPGDFRSFIEKEINNLPKQ